MHTLILIKASNLLLLDVQPLFSLQAFTTDTHTAIVHGVVI